MKRIFGLVLLLTTAMFQLALADFQREVRLLIPWGRLPGHIPLQETPGGWQSVTSFEVKGKYTYLMLENSGEIMLFNGQNIAKTIQTHLKTARDFQLATDGTLRYIMDSRQIFEKRDQKLLNIWVNPWKLKPNSRIIRADNNFPQVLVNLSETISVREDGTKIQPGVINRQGHYGQLHRRSGSEMVLTIDGDQLTVLHPARGSWGSGQYLGSSDSGNHYLLLEEIQQTYPLKLRREILVLNQKGGALGFIYIPATLHVPVTREFQLDGNGSLHELITTQQGAVILSYIWNAGAKDQVFRMELPPKYQEISPRPFSGDSMLPGFPPGRAL